MIVSACVAPDNTVCRNFTIHWVSAANLQLSKISGDNQTIKVGQSFASIRIARDRFFFDAESCGCSAGAVPRYRVPHSSGNAYSVEWRIGDDESNSAGSIVVFCFYADE